MLVRPLLACVGAYEVGGGAQDAFRAPLVGVLVDGFAEPFGQFIDGGEWLQRHDGQPWDAPPVAAGVMNPAGYCLPLVTRRVMGLATANPTRMTTRA